MICEVASAAESVMVMMKLVATKPSSARTNSFPFPAKQQVLEHRNRSRTKSCPHLPVWFLTNGILPAFDLASSMFCANDPQT